jgi:hypothetical protein
MFFPQNKELLLRARYLVVHARYIVDRSVLYNVLKTNGNLPTPQSSGIFFLCNQSRRICKAPP